MDSKVWGACPKGQLRHMTTAPCLPFPSPSSLSSRSPRQHPDGTSYITKLLQSQKLMSS